MVSRWWCGTWVRPKTNYINGENQRSGRLACCQTQAGAFSDPSADMKQGRNMDYL